MSDDLVQKFIAKREEVEALRKAIDTRLNSFVAVIGHLRGYDSDERERWRSVSITTMATPVNIAGNMQISPKDWLTLEELGNLLSSWHKAIDELGKAWQQLAYHDRLRLVKNEPPGY